MISHPKAYAENKLRIAAKLAYKLYGDDFVCVIVSLLDELEKTSVLSDEAIMQLLLAVDERFLQSYWPILRLSPTPDKLKNKGRSNNTNSA